jgi:hypothetical protein
MFAVTTATKSLLEEKAQPKTVGLIHAWRLCYFVELRPAYIRPRPARRLPPPWSVEELDACFIVKDSGGHKLAFVYFEDEQGRRSAAKLLTHDEARRVATNIAKRLVGRT